MSRQTSVATKKAYGLQRVCRIWQIARSTLYSNKTKAPQKRGPKPVVSDPELLERIRDDLEKTPFSGEGYRKVHARIRRDVSVGRNRVLRLMREHHLLSPYRVDGKKAKEHTGTICTDSPGEMWSTDGSKVFTLQDGWVWFFGVLEHWNAECVGWHVTRRGDRFAEAEAVREGVSRYYSDTPDAARGLALRTDWGSQYTSAYFLDQTKHWGIHQSFGYVREPETNGVVERFHRTLKEQVIHGRTYRTATELRDAIGTFIETYNRHWLLEKLGYQSPLEARTSWRAAA